MPETGTIYVANYNALPGNYRKSKEAMTVTENASRMLLDLSPSGTAMKLRVHCGARAERLVEKWIVHCAKVTPLPITGIAFWCDVDMRLNGLQLSECEPHVTLSAFDREHYDAMLAHVGMKKGGYSLGGSPAPRHLAIARSARRKT